MNSRSGNGKAGSNSAFDFDLGLGSGRPQSMNDLKNQTSTYSSATTYTYLSGQQKGNTSEPSWTQRSSKAAWMHQPAASVQSGMKGSVSGPTSMVGDIFGKTWNSPSPSSSVGIVDNKNSNLFGDLLGSLNKSSNNVPLKNVATSASQNSFSMGSLAGSLPKPKSSVNANSGGNYKASSSLSGVSFVGNANSSQALGGPSMKSMSGNGVAKDLNHDPFASFVDFGAKPGKGMSNMSKESVKMDLGSDPFGEFQNSASKDSVSEGVFTPNFTDPLGDFGVSTTQTSLPNDFDALFSSSPNTEPPENVEFTTSQKFTNGDEWGIKQDSHVHEGNNTDLEGLPPVPAGVSASSAKNKGMDNYKQGQFADAIKWLSWSVILLENAGDLNGLTEVLTSRASCYKEVGEYKKAVADCSKVLGQDSKNVAALVQRALLYESMEKYKLGAEDLRTVMKLDPGNRIARSTIHRLNKLAEY